MKLLTFEEFRKVNSKDHRVGYGLAQAYGDYCAREAVKPALEDVKAAVDKLWKELMEELK